MLCPSACSMRIVVIQEIWKMEWMRVLMVVVEVEMLMLETAVVRVMIRTTGPSSTIDSCLDSQSFVWVCLCVFVCVCVCV